MNFRRGWYWYNTKYGCGGIKVANGKVVDGAPIFRRLKGKLAGVLNYGEYKWIGY